MTNAYVNAMISGLPGPNGLPALNPLGDWQTFRDAMGRLW